MLRHLTRSLLQSRPPIKRLPCISVLPTKSIAWRAVSFSNIKHVVSQKHQVSTTPMFHSWNNRKFTPLRSKLFSTASGSDSSEVIHTVHDLKPTNDPVVVSNNLTPGRLTPEQCEILTKEVNELKEKKNVHVLIYAIENYKNLQSKDQSECIFFASQIFDHAFAKYCKEETKKRAILITYYHGAKCADFRCGSLVFLSNHDVRNFSDNYMKPHFAKGNIYQGLYNGLQHLKSLLPDGGVPSVSAWATSASSSASSASPAATKPMPKKISKFRQWWRDWIAWNKAMLSRERPVGVTLLYGGTVATSSYYIITYLWWLTKWIMGLTFAAAATWYLYKKYCPRYKRKLAEKQAKKAAKKAAAATATATATVAATQTETVADANPKEEKEAKDKKAEKVDPPQTAEQVQVKPEVKSETVEAVMSKANGGTKGNLIFDSSISNSQTSGFTTVSPPHHRIYVVQEPEPVSWSEATSTEPLRPIDNTPPLSWSESTSTSANATETPAAPKVTEIPTVVKVAATGAAVAVLNRDFQEFRAGEREKEKAAEAAAVKPVRHDDDTDYSYTSISTSNPSRYGGGSSCGSSSSGSGYSSGGSSWGSSSDSDSSYGGGSSWGSDSSYGGSSSWGGSSSGSSTNSGSSSW